MRIARELSSLMSLNISKFFFPSEPAPPQFKVEIKNDVIPEEEEEAGAAMSKVASHLRMVIISPYEILIFINYT